MVLKTLIHSMCQQPCGTCVNQAEMVHGIVVLVSKVVILEVGTEGVVMVVAVDGEEGLEDFDDVEV